jgi:hypothetical protein
MAFCRRKPDSPTSATAEARSDDRSVALWCDGVWVGPRSLRVFVRQNRFLVGFWAFVLTGISVAIWADTAGLRSWLLILPLAIPTGAAATAGVAFGFSRGWIGDGN